MVTFRLLGLGYFSFLIGCKICIVSVLIYIKIHLQLISLSLLLYQKKYSNHTDVMRTN